MIRACEEGRRAFFRSQSGRVEQVLFESVLPDGSWEGYTLNYTPVRVQSAEKLQGQCRAVRLAETPSAAEESGQPPVGDFCQGDLLPETICL